jgi:hypothetical protein
MCASVPPSLTYPPVSYPRLDDFVISLPTCLVSIVECYAFWIYFDFDDPTNNKQEWIFWESNRVNGYYCAFEDKNKFYLTANKFIKYSILNPEVVNNPKLAPIRGRISRETCYRGALSFFDFQNWSQNCLGYELTVNHPKRRKYVLYQGYNDVHKQIEQDYQLETNNEKHWFIDCKKRFDENVYVYCFQDNLLPDLERIERHLTEWVASS